MKKITKYICLNIRLPLLALLIMMSTLKAISQNVQQVQAVQAPSAIPVLNACGSYPASGTFVKASTALNAGNKCNTTITASLTKVYFTAGRNIILSPGFTAVKGSNFVAYIKNDSLDNIAPQQATIVQESALSNEKLNESITVTPNPFTASFILSINSKQDVKAQLVIYNSFGVKVQDQTAVNLLKGANKLSVNCSNFASGVYMLEVNFGDSKIVKKIIKSN